MSTSLLSGVDLPDLMNHYRVPGCSVAVLDGGEIVEQAAFGVRRADAPDPMAVDTRLQTASISKPVSVFAALRLVDAGLLALDLDIREYLTRWQPPRVGSWQPRLTVRQLASHTAGLTTSGFMGYRRGEAVPSIEQVLGGTTPANSPTVRVDALPGVVHRYSGGGLTVLQLLIEEVTAQPAAEALAQWALDPLGMDSSCFAQPLPPELAETAAHGHWLDGSPVDGGWHVFPELCAAGLWTTPTDLLKFAQGVIAAARSEAGALLSPALAQQMLSPQVKDLPARIGRLPGLNACGLGLFLRVTEGETSWWGHGGANTGYKAQFAASHRTGQGIAVMTNADGGQALLTPVFEAAARNGGWIDVEMGEPFPGPSPEELQSFVGRYVGANGIGLELVERGPELMLVVAGQDPQVTIAISPHELVTVELGLVLSRRGSSELAVLHAGQEDVFTRVG